MHYLYNILQTNLIYKKSYVTDIRDMRLKLPDLQDNNVKFIEI